MKHSYIDMLYKISEDKIRNGCRVDALELKAILGKLRGVINMLNGLSNITYIINDISLTIVDKRIVYKTGKRASRVELIDGIVDLINKGYMSKDIHIYLEHNTDRGCTYLNICFK